MNKEIHLYSKLSRIKKNKIYSCKHLLLALLVIVMSIPQAYAEKDFTNLLPKEVELNEAQIKGLRSAMSDPNPRVRSRAIIALGKQQDEESFVKITELLNNEEINTKIAAIIAIGHYGEKSNSLIPALIDNLGSKNDKVRLVSVTSISKINPKLNKTQIAKVITLLGDGNHRIRSAATSIIDRHPREASANIASILELLENENPKTRSDAVKTLGHMGAAGYKYKSKIIDLFEDEDNSVRASAVLALANTGKATKEDVSKIGNLLIRDNNQFVCIIRC